MEDFSFYLQCGSLFIAICGGLFALYQYIKNAQLKKAEMLHNLVDKMRSDQDIRAVVREVERERFKYDLAFYESGWEEKLDKTLEYLSFFCYLRINHFIGRKEFSFLEYEIRVLASNTEIQEYMFNLYHYAKNHVFTSASTDSKEPTSYNTIVVNNIDSNVMIPFHYFLLFAWKEKLLKADFFICPGAYDYVIESYFDNLFI